MRRGAWLHLQWDVPTLERLFGAVEDGTALAHLQNKATNRVVALDRGVLGTVEDGVALCHLLLDPVVGAQLLLVERVGLLHLLGVLTLPRREGRLCTRWAGGGEGHRKGRRRQLQGVVQGGEAEEGAGGSVRGRRRGHWRAPVISLNCAISARCSRESASLASPARAAPG